jgi:hypothetical protein
MSNKPKIMAYGAAALLFAAVLVAMVPTVSAQTQKLTVELKEKQRDSPLVMPETGIVKVTITPTITVPGASACIQNVKVDYRVSKKEAYASAYINPPSQSFTHDTSGAPIFTTPSPKTLSDINLFITVNREAPAFFDGAYEVTATATPTATSGGGCNWEAGSTVLPITLKNDNLVLVQVRPTNFLIKTGQNAKVQFPIELENRGNGPVKIQVTAASGKNKLDAVIPPSLILLDSRLKGTTAAFKQQAFITAQTPHKNGYTNSFYQIDATFKSKYDGTVPQGSLSEEDEQFIVLSIQVQGVYAPGVDPAMLIGGIGAAMLGFRRFVRSD